MKNIGTINKEKIIMKYKVILWNENNNVIYSSLERTFDDYTEAFKFKWDQLENKYTFNKGKIEEIK